MTHPTPTTAASVPGDAAIAQAFREAADRYKGSGHYDDFIYQVETAAALASKADGWEAMTKAAMDLKMRHVDDHQGDIYHALQSLIVKFGKPWDGKLTEVTRPAESVAQGGELQKCPDCKGSGDYCLGGHSAHPDNWRKCELCKGSGKLTTPTPATGSGGDDRILWGIVANAGRLSSRRTFRWAHVVDATGQGSNSSAGLCRRFGFDPDEQVGGDDDDEQEHPAPAGGDTVTVDDAMVERACKRYAFREDGAVWPDAYSEHEVAAERVLMREFLLHALTAKPGAEGVIVDSNELAELGKLAIASEEARRRRVGARKLRQDRVREWHRENGDDLDSRYHEDTLSKEFIAFTAQAMAEYKVATGAAISARQRVIHAVARISKATGETP